MAVRGNYTNELNHGTFPWSRTVIGLCYFLVRSKQWSLLEEEPYIMSSEQDEFTISLHYLLSKSPNWLKDIFGETKNGRAVFKSLVQVTNPEQKREGAATIALNSARILGSDLHIFLNDKEIESYEALGNLADSLKQSWFLAKGSNLQLATALNDLSSTDQYHNMALPVSEILDKLGPTMHFEKDWLNFVTEVQAGCSKAIYGMLPHDRPAVAAFLKELRGTVYFLTNKQIARRGLPVNRLVVIDEKSLNDFESNLIHALVLEGLGTSVRLVFAESLKNLLPKGIDTFSIYDDECVELADTSNTGKACILTSYPHLQEYKDMHISIWEDPSLSLSLEKVLEEHPQKQRLMNTAQSWLYNLDMMEHSPLIQRLRRR